MKAEFAAVLLAALVAGAFFYSAIGEDFARAPDVPPATTKSPRSL